jgi:hypothetical protein
MATDPISCAEAAKVRPHETADEHIARDLLESENARLRAEVTRLESALHTASRLMRSIDGVLAPYAGQRKTNR